MVRSSLLPAAADHYPLVLAPDHKLYAFAGRTGFVQQYDPAADSWATGAPMPIPRGWPVAAAPGNGRIYVLGGFDPTTAFPWTWYATNQEAAIPGEQLAFTSQPPLDLTVGQQFTTQVTVEDTSGAPLHTAEVSIKLTATDAAGTPSTALTCAGGLTSSRGVTAFTCSLRYFSTYYLHATAKGFLEGNSGAVLIGCPIGQYATSYYANMTLSGDPTFSRCEPDIHHGTAIGGWPGHGLSGRAFSVRTASDFKAGSQMERLRIWVVSCTIMAFTL